MRYVFTATSDFKSGGDKILQRVSLALINMLYLNVKHCVLSHVPLNQEHSFLIKKPLIEVVTEKLVRG